MIHYLRHIMFLGGLLLVQSCAKEISQEDLIQEAVQIKLDQWKALQQEACKERAITEAEDYVDSILVVISLQSKLDTIPKPTKPMKPPKPSFKVKPDSVVVDPIYKKD
jgi:hypothetical protein